MKIVAIMPARNESWCIGLSARALLKWVDELIVLDHASTDETPEILREIRSEYPGRLNVITETDPVWNEMDHRQRLLAAARERKASHVVMIDADEIVTGNLIENTNTYIRDMVEAVPRGYVMQLPWLQLRNSPMTVVASGQWSSQDVSMGFLDSPECHWSARDGYHFHQRAPMGRPEIAWRPLGPAFIPSSRKAGVMHLQMASERRLRAKQRLYVMQETVRWPGRKTAAELNAMYGPTVYVHAELRATPAEWWAPYAGLMRYLDVDAEPWQECECERLLAEYGAETFRGLDLFDD